MNVTKRDGTIVPLDIEKIHQVCEWACDGLKKVSVSDIEINAKLQFHNKIKTKDIHNILIKSAVDLISERNPNYEFVASRLVIMDVRKKVYGGFNPIPFRELIEQNIKAKKYDPVILERYNDKEIEELQKYIKYDRDYTFTYAGLRQLVDKYFVQNRKTKQLFECPQEMFMLIGMYMFQYYPDESRLRYIKIFYDKISTHKISLPTPIISGVRTILKQFASCCLIDVDDTKESLVHSKSAVALYTAARSGIGLNWRLRGVDAEVGGGDVIHTGIIPFLKSYESTTKEFTQNSVRGGNSTSNFPFFTWEIEDIIVLKNNKGIEENRVRGMDYAIAISSLLLERAMKNEDFTVFSLEEVPELYEAFYSDTYTFKELYEKYERKTSIRKKKINAREFLTKLLTERFETGRIYLMFVDNVESQNRFEIPVFMSNLCMEITLPTKPINHIDDEQGEIATCILSCVNAGKIEDEQDLEECCDVIVRFLDELIDYQEYPVKAAENSTKRRRNLGIGISDYFHFLAKNKVRYDTQEARDLTHEFMERFQYSLIKASNQIAKEKGACEYNNETKYSKGILPIDLYSKAVDLLAKPEYKCDWESLRESLKEYGIRHSVLSAIPPTASSSLVSNSTPGIDAPRSLLTVKVSKKGTVKQLVPEFNKCSSYYTTAWELENLEYLKLIAIMQKFIDQSISANEFYDIKKYPDNKVPLSEMLKVLQFCNKYGIKTLYYSNTNDGSDEEESGCVGGACAV